MPRRDKTGPDGEGKGTGRKLGPCYDESSDSMPRRGRRQKC